MIYKVALSGLGSSSPILNMSTSQLASFATSTAGGITAASLALVGLGPIGAIVGIGTQLAALLISQFQGCGQTCILTSDAANQVEQLLIQNLNAYLQSGHTISEQQAALANFDNTWAKLVQFCGNPQFGTAGQNCTQDRQAGSCKWKASQGGWNGSTWVPYGPAGSGSACWNWFVGYRDPIANDPNVKPDATVSNTISNIGGSITDTISSMFNGGSIGSSGALFGISTNVLMIGALVLGGIFLTSRH